MIEGVVYELSWVTIHNIKPDHVDYLHVEGFQDGSIYEITMVWKLALGMKHPV